MKAFAVLFVLVLALGGASQVVGQIRDSIGPDSSMTDGQPGAGHQDTTDFGGGVASLVVQDMTQEAPYRLIGWGGVFHGFGSLSGPGGPAPSFQSTTFDVIWHRTLASVVADVGAHGVNPGFDGMVWNLPMHDSEEFWGSTFDNGPFTTVRVTGGVGTNNIIVEGGYVIIRPNHSSAESVLASTGSIDPIGQRAPPDIWCDGSGPSNCSVLTRRHGWSLQGAPVAEEVPTLRWPAAFALGLLLVAVLVSWRSRGRQRLG